MREISAAGRSYQELNRMIRESAGEGISIKECLGQRYLAAGLGGGEVRLSGTPGNALGACLDGAVITLRGNGQEAVGDTMNAGRVVIHGSCGDSLGYGMRGGVILVRDDVGCRAGIHLKSYEDHLPVIVIGGSAGSFLGEYQAGGLILVLGIGRESRLPVGRFCGTGMHGGRMLLRTRELPFDLPPQVLARQAGKEDMAEFLPYIQDYCETFSVPLAEALEGDYYLLTPNSSSPYKRLYA